MRGDGTGKNNTGAKEREEPGNEVGNAVAENVKRIIQSQPRSQGPLRRRDRTLGTKLIQSMSDTQGQKNRSKKQTMKENHLG